MTPDLSLLSGFARGVLLSFYVRDTCLHSGSWLLSGLIQRQTGITNPKAFARSLNPKSYTYNPNITPAYYSSFHFPFHYPYNMTPILNPKPYIIPL